MKQYELNFTLNEREIYVLYTMMSNFINDDKNSYTWRDLSIKIQKSIENELLKNTLELPKLNEIEYEMKFM